MYRLSSFTTILMIVCWNTGNADISNYKHPGLGITNSFHNGNAKLNNFISVVSLTQDGYIQFLRYIVDVPVITEFTFCLWIKSKNLTYAHPLLSYSEHEKHRYIRSWISPQGTEINLAILENSVTIATNFRQKKWYHICQSWDSLKGYWAFYLNGELILSKYDNKLKGLKIPKGGDIVVGQEYTDFDKGLDDGIEGDIFGFNMILSSTRTPRNKNVFLPYGIENRAYDINQDDYKSIQINNKDVVPNVLSYFTVGVNRAPRNMFDDGRRLLYNFWNIFDTPETIRIKTVQDYYPNESLLRSNVNRNSGVLPEPAIKRISGNGIVNDVEGINQKPLGLQLVELTYNCALRKGSPIEHKKVLVSWTKTSVRVFGGAVLRNVRPFCFKQNAG